MNTAYFDCFCGAAGDMILAALLDAGLSIDVLHKTIADLALPGVSLEAARVRRHGLAAAHVTVRIDASTPRKHRHLKHIEAILTASSLAPSVAERARAIFRRLADAEALAHGTTVEKVHFHEVGAEDAIVDIVGACAGLEALGVTRVLCSPIPTGSGVVTCDHGVMPVPAPATANLLKGVPLAACDETGELTTPTGAAILTSLAESFGPLPEMRVSAIGIGAGTREGATRPNILRVFLGAVEASDDAERDAVLEMRTQLDDTTAQSIAFACERLLEAGALDVFTVPIGMKKGRPGTLLTVLCRPADAATLEAILFTHTRTFGVRKHLCQRTRLVRRHQTVQTRFGPIRVKTGSLGGKVVQAWPEFEDCAAAARAHNADLNAVQQEALGGWRRRFGDEAS